MTKPKGVAVLGAGSWGTALALVLGDNGHDVRLWTHNPVQADLINTERKNERYLPGTELPSAITAYSDLGQAINGVDTVVFAVPTKAIREVAEKVESVSADPKTVVHVSKGIEPDTHLRISEILKELLTERSMHGLVVLSGPSHAEEVVLRHPTTVTAASTDLKSAEHVQDLFMNHNFRVYTNSDIIGVEIGGALKNIIALAAGITDGLGYGDNAKAALITRGLAEIARLGTTLGANPLTFSGLAGIGDLIVTCTSVHSRNWRAGNMLGKGKKLNEVLEEMGMVVEGVRTTKAAYQLAQKYEVTMPITQALHRVLFHDVNPKEAVDQLMSRMKTHEMEDLVNILGEQTEADEQ
ncbi:NAD(P)H-dependent glycerol-3-phosphate dehydrogenase [Jeotgalibacillus proteolyticus]|uniref:Glycerol-3-phosphate dehydrogenase [NAD(P)+] n=1 Tax=Jeotgalibacillus proteolyticus TaxID=2082395 RepID=A0A2S5GEH5_9BACL|nr:NAD(P)H-dependent glycerol-3-phosphate dehydrogenase [Jeotgalibacillus proteolyticus]PPA71273.1 NAD(P)H-dependent glycerol-3-phosphate dehydrogenase [Jeotgalibacillus proteolyticus]